MACRLHPIIADMAVQIAIRENARSRTHTRGRTAWIAACLAVAALSLFWAVQRPSGDVAAFIAAARQADYFGAFPGNVYEAWELKPLGHRILWRVLYCASALIAPYEDKALYEPTIRLLYSLLAILVILVSIHVARAPLRHAGISPPAAFAFLGLAFFGMNNWALMQAEHSALLLAIPAAALTLRPEVWARFAAGVLLALLVTLKGVTIVLAPQALLLAAALPRERRPSLLPTIAGLAAGLVLIAMAAVYVFPRELQDLRNAAIWQGADQIRMEIIAPRLWAFLASTANGIAVIKLGIAAAVILLLFRSRIGLRSAAPIGAAWLLGLAGLLSQRHLFGYQFLLLWLPAAACAGILLLRWNAAPDASRLRKECLAFGLLLLALSVGARPFWWLIPFVPLGWLVWISARPRLAVALPAFCALLAATALAGWEVPNVPEQVRKQRPVRELFAEWNHRYQLHKESVVLYLDAGYAAYAVGARSWCRYFFALPIQRTTHRKLLLKLPVTQETLARILQYEGRYIVHHFRWLPLPKVPELDAMIRERYRLIARDEECGFALYVRQQEPSQ